jgi:hypothetical protein
MRARRWTGSTILTAFLLAPGGPALASPAGPSAGSKTPAATARGCPARAGWTMLDQADALARFSGRSGATANWIGIDAAGALRWNGIPIQQARVYQYLQIIEAMRPKPALVINLVTGADCMHARAIAAAAEARNACDPPACIITTGPALPPMPLPPAPPAPSPPRK